MSVPQWHRDSGLTTLSLSKRFKFDKTVKKPVGLREPGGAWEIEDADFQLPLRPIVVTIYTKHSHVFPSF
ncbi:MAG: hypothetical protein ACRERV_06750 [Methylococcales bacterium]